MHEAIGPQREEDVGSEKEYTHGKEPSPLMKSDEVWRGGDPCLCSQGGDVPLSLWEPAITQEKSALTIFFNEILTKREKPESSRKWGKLEWGVNQNELWYGERRGGGEEKTPSR